MSFINEKRQKFATALERARHNSTSSVNSTSSIDEFNTSLSCISVDSLDAFSDPFGCELGECGGLFDDESLGDTFNSTKWSPSQSASDSLASTFEVCGWDLESYQEDQWPLQACQTEENSLDLYCGTDDFLATAEDTLDVLSRLVYNNSENTEVDLIDMIDNRQYTPMHASDNSLFGSKSTNILNANDSDTFSVVPTTIKPETAANSVLKQDIWLCDRSANNVEHAPQCILISPNSKACKEEEAKITKFTTYVSNTPESFKREIGVAIDTCTKQEEKRRKRSDLTPEDLLIKKEKNRLRSKAYRERRKLQLQTLKEQVILAKLEADIAKKQAKMASRKR